jgi:anti-anti-sigma regulatory factor
VNVPLIDQTGAFALETAIEKWQQKGIRVILVGIQPHIRKILEDIGAGVNEENCFDRFEKAIEAINLWETSSADDFSSGVL